MKLSDMKNRFKSVFLIGFMLILALTPSTSFGQQTYTLNHGFGANGSITIKATATCGGQVQYSVWCNRKFRSVNIKYGNGAYMPLTNENLVPGVGGNGEFADNTLYQWTKTFPNTNPSTTLQISFQYKGFGWCGACWSDPIMSYGYVGDNPDVTVSFTKNQLSPNTWEFIYTGDNLLTGTGVSSYSYTFDYDINQTNPLIQGNSLTPNGLIGTNPSTANPHFYCQTGQPDNTSAQLSVDLNYALGGKTLTCKQNPTEGINLDDLCTYISGFNVENTPPDQFSSLVTTSTISDPTLAGQVQQHTINFGDTPSNSNVNLGQNIPHTYAQEGSYNVEEYIEFEPGCGCTQNTNYNTNNPCYQMSPIGIVESFVNGEYVYTITPSEYTGNAGFVPTNININWGDGNDDDYQFGDVITHVYDNQGSYGITQTTYFEGFEPCVIYTKIISNEFCCENFAPEPNRDYWISAWVQEEHAQQVLNYPNAYLQLKFNDGAATVEQFNATGDIIEGWQRIVGKFKVPGSATEMDIEMINDNPGINAYFDDIRIHPFNGSMKSYVYDPETLWLTAELDDNNYATFYEYDKEGQLIRIKKETARGIMTIQESRSSNPKKQ